MRIKVEMDSVDDTAIAAILKVLKKIENCPEHYMGCQKFAIELGDKE